MLDVTDYKIFVFDLDSTLYLRDINNISRNKYHKDIKKFLELLKSKDKIICLATHNSYPFNALKEIKIYKLFNIILYQEYHDNLYSIEHYTNKRYMLNKISELTNSSMNEIIFFDDSEYNIKQVEELGIKSIHVNKRSGIILDDIVLN